MTFVCDLNGKVKVFCAVWLVGGTRTFAKIYWLFRSESQLQVQFNEQSIFVTRWLYHSICLQIQRFHVISRKPI